MGLNVGKTKYQIHDNSWSTEYYVSTPALIKKGGMDKLEELAYKIFYLQYEEWMNYKEDYWTTEQIKRIISNKCNPDDNWVAAEKYEQALKTIKELEAKIDDLKEHIWALQEE